MLEDCEDLQPNEVIVFSQFDSIDKHDMTKSRILKEPILLNSIVLYFRKNHFIYKAVDRKISFLKAAGIIYYLISCFGKDKTKQIDQSTIPRL